MAQLGREIVREKSLRDLYYVLFRHKNKVLLFFLATVLTVTVLTFVCPEVYRSEAKLLVRLGRESVTLDPTATTGETIHVSQPRESEINSELEILESRELLLKVVETLGPDAILGRSQAKNSLLERVGLAREIEDRERAALDISEDLDIEVQTDSNILAISYEAGSPTLARDVVATLIDVYLEKHIAVHRTPGSYEFFSKQSAQLGSRLEELENELRRIKSETGISSLEEQRRVLVNRLHTLELNLDVAVAASISSRAKVDALRRSVGSVNQTLILERATGFPNAVSDAMRQKLFDLKLEEQALLSNGHDADNPLVRAIREQSSEALEMLRVETPVRTQQTEGVNTTYQSLHLALLTEEAELSTLQAKVEALRNQVGEAQRALREFSADEVRISHLLREIDLVEGNYRKYSENFEQARIDQALETGKISNISVVQEATTPLDPIRPKKLLNLLMGVCAGFMGGIALAFLCEHLDHSIKTPEDAESKLRLPALASIPRTPEILAGLSATSAAASPEEQADRVGPRTEATFQALSERLLQMSNNSSDSKRVFGVTGSRRGEGVSTVAANLAAHLARSGGGSVLLVDADFEHPSVHSIFESALSPGLVDELANGQTQLKSVRRSPVENLLFLAAGGINGNLRDGFRTKGFADLLWVMKNQYEYVVIDAPPVNASSYTAGLSSLCDGVLFVVETEHSRWEAALNAKDLLEESNAKVMGVVLNKRQFHVPQWLYGRL